MTLLEELRSIVEGSDSAVDKTVKAFIKAMGKLGDVKSDAIRVNRSGNAGARVSGERNGHAFSVSLDEKNDRIRTSVEVDGRLVAGGSPDSDDAEKWMMDAARAIVVNTKAESEIGILRPEDVVVLGRALTERTSGDSGTAEKLSPDSQATFVLGMLSGDEQEAYKAIVKRGMKGAGKEAEDAFVKGVERASKKAGVDPVKMVAYVRKILKEAAIGEDVLGLLDEARKKSGGTEYRVYPSTTGQEHRKFYTRAEAEKYLKSIEDDSPNAGISEMPIKENLDEATSREVLYSIESTYEDKDGAKKTSKDSWQAKWGKPTKANLEKVASKFSEGKLLSARLVRTNGDVVATYGSKTEGKCKCPKCGEMSTDDEKCSECDAAIEPVEEGATAGARSKGTGFGRSETKKAGEFWDKGSDEGPNRKPEFNKAQRAGKKKHIAAQMRGEGLASELGSLLSEDWS